MNGTILDSIECYDPRTESWYDWGQLPNPVSSCAAYVTGDMLHIFDGGGNNGVLSLDLKTSISNLNDIYIHDGNGSAVTPIVHAEVADGSVTTAKLDPIILKYLKPEITSQAIGKIVYEDSNVSFSVTAEGKYLTYQWKKDGSDLTGENNVTLNITDANATQHDGNYSVVVSNDFGNVESDVVEVKVSDALMNGLVAWWKFDEANGTVAYDSSGNDLDGTTNGNPPWVSGKIGGALSFNGSNQFVSLPAIPKIAGSVAKSLCFFHKPESNVQRSIVSLGSASNNKRFCIFQDSNNKYRFVGHSNDLFFDVTMNLLWQHVAAVYETNLLKFYIDGSLAEEESIIGLNTSAEDHGRIAKNSSPKSDEYYKGLIDEVRIYDRALTAAEVQALYNMGQ